MTCLSDVFENERCCGCGSCVNSCPVKAISFGKDAFGFVIPIIDEKKCKSCGLCVRNCPYNTNNSEKKDSETFKPIAFAGVNKDLDVVAGSSSGGIFYSLAKAVLEDGGVVFGACMDDHFVVRHVAIDSIKNLYLIQRSKYIQSFMGNVYSQVKETLLKNKRVLFSGTPCQAAGLKSFLHFKDYENLLIVEVVCHGTPNQDLFDDYRSYLESCFGKLKSYTFRYKEKKENGMKWFSSFETSQKRFIFNWPEDSYNYYYMQSLTYRESCYECKFAKKERNADLTLCDYWHWEGLHKEDFSKKDSVSGIVVNTIKGKRAIKEISSNLKLVESSFEYLSSHNSCLIEPCGKKTDRIYILNKWKNEGYAALDAEFKRKYKKQILKYRLMRYIPDAIFSFLYRLKNGR